MYTDGPGCRSGTSTKVLSDMYETLPKNWKSYHSYFGLNPKADPEKIISAYLTGSLFSKYYENSAVQITNDLVRCPIKWTGPTDV